jgi:hypothetical protein
MWNSLASSLLVTCLIHDERAYKDVMAKAGKIPGLRGRWLAHERRRCARMKAAIAYRRQSCRSSNLSFRAITRQRAAKSGSLKNSIERRRDLPLQGIMRQKCHPLVETRLPGWACRIRTGESVRALSDWNYVTTSFEVVASPAAETLPVEAA